MGFNLSEGKKLAAKVTEILRKSMKKRRKIRAKKAKAKPAGNEETHSLTSTKHDIGVSKIPDLVVAHVHLKRGSEPKKKDSPDYLAYQLRLGYRVVHICHVIIMENKTGPSRRITDAQELDQEVKGGLIVAQKDLIRQLALHFTQDLCSDQVIAVSAAGLYWRWLLVERRMFAGVPLQSALTFGNNKTEASIPAKHLAPLGKLAKVFQKRPYYVLGTPESDTEWQKLRNDTLIPHLNKHKLYPHTTLVTPKDYSSATPGPSRT
ncbi:hypothetical protein K474DRAFT_617209 [Panus rudis PR-1116 ss-1]|nr:hypothetical protein K474DRAFT_617209 [Panus rudis PR-1116 ss-1]